MWKGIDVSDNQGTINWAQIPEDVDFAVLRSVRRSGKADHQFATNLEGCRKHNIPVSVYKYTYAATQDAARQEAQQVVELLRSHHLTGMVWWDVEDKDVLRPLGAAKLTECIRAAQEVITAAGYGFGLYVGLYVYKERWFDFNAFAGTRLWIARYYRGYRTMRFDDEPDQKYKRAEVNCQDIFCTKRLISRFIDCCQLHSVGTAFYAGDCSYPQSSRFAFKNDSLAVYFSCQLYDHIIFLSPLRIRK